MRWKTVIISICMTAGALYLCELSTGAPRPKAVPESWELQFKYHDLQAIRVRQRGYEEPQTFWYLMYTVVNRTGEDQLFVPEIVLCTDSGDLHTAGMGVSKAVYTAIKKLHNEPLLRTPSAMTGKLLQGEDNAKHGVAIWPDFDPDSKTVDIFFGGLSGETAELVLPKPIEKRLRTPSGEEKVITKTKLMLFKTRHLRFKLVGDVDSRPLNTPVLLSRDWVMR